MKALKINPASIKEAIVVLERGSVIVYPTETSYALGADALNKKACEKIYKIKKRSKNKPLPMIVSNFKMAEKYVRFDPLSKKLAKKYWPGPLTVVLPRKKGKGDLALRVSSNKIAKFLSLKIGRPIISTSANIAGRQSLYNIKDVIKEFQNKKHKPDLILDGGILPKVKPSTIVKAENGKVKVLRRGWINI